MNEFSQHIYTDGSKDRKRCGFGVYSDNLIEISHRLSDNSNIYNAEATAILVALEEIKRRDLNNTVIFCDSQGVMKRLNSLGLKSDNNLIISEILIILCDSVI